MMNRIKRNPILAGLLLGLLGYCTYALADVARTGYQDTRGTIGSGSGAPVKVFNGVSSATSSLWAGTGTSYRINGNPKVGMAISGNFPADTIQVSMGRYHRNPSGGMTFLGVADVQTITLTSSVQLIESGTGVYWSADDIEFDTQGLNSVEFRVTGVGSSDDINGWVWGYGVTPTLTAN